MMSSTSSTSALARRRIGEIFQQSALAPATSSSSSSSTTKPAAVFGVEFVPADDKTVVAQRISRTQKWQPAWVGVTWHVTQADQSRKTLQLVQNLTQNTELNCMMHLTCRDMTKTQIREVLDQCKALGVRNILALRGDGMTAGTPKGDHGGATTSTSSSPVTTEAAVEGTGCEVDDKNVVNKNHSDQQFQYAIELIQFIRTEYGDFFGIACAGYPEMHPDSKQDLEKDIFFLKQKVAAGADVIITQFFYDVGKFFEFKIQCRKSGIECPIIPGIMPITSYARLGKINRWNPTAAVPAALREELEKRKEDGAALRAFGIEECVRSCRLLLEEEYGAAEGEKFLPGLYFFTLNQDDVIHEILKALKLVE
ncbi:unnamed protein product [Amoebophrya sp. A120]|nr:unnamed protein product [Amoebophrya sp. A120]|eukprot:GSA120T00020831001.1